MRHLLLISSVLLFASVAVADKFYTEDANGNLAVTYTNNPVHIAKIKAHKEKEKVKTKGKYKVKDGKQYWKLTGPWELTDIIDINAQVAVTKAILLRLNREYQLWAAAAHTNMITGLTTDLNAL